MEILWNRTSRTIWDRLVRGAALQQDWAYGAACEALGSTVLRAEIRDHGKRIGAIQLIHRPLLKVLHAVVGTRGPIWAPDIPPERIPAAMRALARSIPLPKLRGLFVTPENGDSAAMQSIGFHRVMTPYATVVLDLDKGSECLRESMHQKWRNRLSVAEQSGLKIQRADARPEHYLWLLEAERHQQKRLRYRALPPELVPAWHASGGQLRVYTASHDDRIVAAMLFLLHGDTATYHIGFSNEDGRKLSAHNLLMWTAMRRLPKTGIATLDLGGLNTHESPGIARFKLGTGGQVKTLCGTWFSR